MTNDTTKDVITELKTIAELQSNPSPSPILLNPTSSSCSTEDFIYNSIAKDRT